jgi:hypothetical protein
VVTGVGAVVATLIAAQTAMSSFKIAKGLMNIGRGSLMGNPNIPQKVIVTNMGALGGGGGLDAGDLDADGKGKKGGKGGGSGRGFGVGSAVKGAAVVAVVDAGFKVVDTYNNAKTQDEKAEGYGGAAGGLAGTLAGAAAGAALGSVVPVIGTVVGGIVGGILGNMGGDALGGYLGKSMFGADESLKSMPAAGPLMMANAGKNVPPVMGDIAKSFDTAPKAFEPPPAPPVSYDPRDPDSKDAMLLPHFANKVRFPGSELRQPKVTRSGLEDPEPGDTARAMMLPPASADAAAVSLAPAAPAKAEGVKVDSKVDIQAPMNIVVNGDVKDPAQLYAQLRPYFEQHQRDIAQQLESRKLYDAPNI